MFTTHNTKLELIKLYCRFPARANTTSSHIPSISLPIYPTTETTAEATLRRLTTFLLPATTLNFSLVEYCCGATALKLGGEAGKSESWRVWSCMFAAGVPRFPLLLYAASMLGKSRSSTGLVVSIRSNYLRAKAGGSKKQNMTSVQIPWEVASPPPKREGPQC